MFSQAAVLLLAGQAVAFPEIARMVQERNLKERQQVGTIVPFPEYPGTPNHALFNEFDPKDQLVSVSGDHAFQAPGPGDIRGPCAGLNAAANHGYIPRSGIMTPESINTGLYQAFGLDKTATIFLETATSFFNGDPLSGRWSIGPHSDKTSSFPPVIGSLLGNETGICAYGHSRSEADSSITRGDWLYPGPENSNCLSYPRFMKELFDLADKRAGGLITPRVLAEHQYNRKMWSVQNNPNVFYPAYGGVAFTFGAHMFAWHLLANHSAEQPRGFLTQDVFMQFFSYTKDNKGNLVYHPGQERIPENWYKRSSNDQWTLTDIGVSTAQQCAAYPFNCKIGGNLGKVNSFAGVDPADVTGGLMNAAQDFTDPSKMGCFIAQTIQADTPSSLSKVFDGVLLQQALSAMQSKLFPTLEPLMALGGGCKGLPKGKSMYEYGQTFPGARFDTEGPRSGY